MQEPAIHPEPVQEFLKVFRKSYSAEEVIQRLKDMKKIRALVIGETILDEYHHVVPIGKPPKGNHIAARYLKQEVHAGGIVACANHMASFCGEIDLLTIIGRKDVSEKLVRDNVKPNIKPTFFYQDRALVKRRYIDYAYAVKLFEVYKNEEPHSSQISEAISQWIMTRSRKSSIRPYDLILVLDYGHNLFDKDLIQTICSLPNFLAVNAQTNTANYGYNPITKYPRANYFCMDEPELRLAYQDRDSNIHALVNALGQRATLPGAISITRGHLGATIYNPGNDQLFEAPVLSRKVVDTTGAGDAFLAVTAPCVAKSLPLDMTVFIGNAVGALAVGYLGNKSSIEADTLYQFIETLLK